MKICKDCKMKLDDDDVNDDGICYSCFMDRERISETYNE